MRKTFALILLIAFVITLPLALLAHGIKTNLLQASYIKNELSKNNIYQQARDEAINQMLASPDLSGSIKQISFFNADDFREMITSVFPVAWLQQNIEMVIDTTFNWFYSQQDLNKVTLKISIRDLKNDALGALEAKVAEKYNSLPACTSAQIKEVAKNTADFSLNCRHPDYNAEGLLKEINFSQFTKDLPDELDLMALLRGEQKVSFDQETPQKSTSTTKSYEEFSKTLNYIRRIFQTVILSLKLLFIILGTFFALIIVLAATSWRSALRWPGLALFFAGTAIASSMIITQNLFNRLILPNIRWEGISTELVATFKTIANETLLKLAKPLNTEGIAIIAGGFILLVTSFIIKKKKA